MLALVQNQAVELQPVPVQNFQLRHTTPDRSGRGRLFLYGDGQIIEAGRTFYSMKGECWLNNLTGEFEIKSKFDTCVFRCVFAGQHLDVEVRT